MSCKAAWWTKQVALAGVVRQGLEVGLGRRALQVKVEAKSAGQPGASCGLVGVVLSWAVSWGARGC